MRTSGKFDQSQHDKFDPGAGVLLSYCLDARVSALLLLK